MKKTILKLSSLFLVFCFIVPSGFVCAKPMSGACGANALWEYDGISTLTISGTGVIDDNSGWEDYIDSIEAIVINDGITEIDQYIFADCPSLVSVDLPDTLESIGRNSFSSCVNLKKIEIPDSVETIHKYAFRYCDDLVIYCSENSYAHTFALSNNIDFRFTGEITITFDNNGGTGSISDIICTSSDEVTIPSTIPTKDGYIFVGWALTADATEAVYYNGDTFTFDSDLTLYAVWVQCVISSESTETNIIIESTKNLPKLNLWVVSYKNRCVVDTKLKEVELKMGINTIQFDKTDIQKDEVKAFLWDNNLRPYAITQKVGILQSYSVKFFDWQDNLINEQTVMHSKNAELPAVQTRSGYDFCGWSGNYNNVTSDSFVIPQYIESSKANTFKVFSAKTKCGDYITLSVYLGGNVELSAFDMNLIYDNSVLEFVSVEDEFDYDIVSNYIPNDSRIRFNFSSIKNKTRQGKVLEVTFKVLQTNESATTVELRPVSVVKIENNQPANTTYNVENGIVSIMK